MRVGGPPGAQQDGGGTHPAQFHTCPRRAVPGSIGVGKIIACGRDALYHRKKKQNHINLVVQLLSRLTMYFFLAHRGHA